MTTLENCKECLQISAIHCNFLQDKLANLSKRELASELSRMANSMKTMAQKLLDEHWEEIKH